MRWGHAVVLGLGLGCGDPPPPAADVVSAHPAAPSAPERPAGSPPLATRLGAMIVDVCTRTASFPLARDPRLDAAIEGHWRGEYEGEGIEPVAFDAALLASAGVLMGTTTEPDTFGAVHRSPGLPPTPLPELAARLSGDVYASRQLVLLKTYHGTVSHSVQYVGMLDDAGQRIEGQWRVGRVHGTFWMERRPERAAYEPTP